MKKQFILVLSGIFLIILLFVFGKTTSNKKNIAVSSIETVPQKTFNIKGFINSEKAKLSPSQAITLSKLENNITRGDIPSQQIKANEALATFWKDSAKSFEPYAFYTSSASKLDNSEKSLTFAARIFLDNLRGEKDEAKLNWQTSEAIDLFERALKLNPDNDKLKIGLGSSYIYGKGRNGKPEETMQGIQQLLSVVRKDSTNMEAQMMLGVGGLVSNQFEKSIERLKKVVAAQPQNGEAVAYLADAYAGKGDKANAVKWYNISKRLVNNPHYTEEVDERIKTLK
ncbi:MAG: tetratricopeptide repeat protein [Ferruginibacter sp.]|nr:tetratricopeptide repeat protein [Ferruginibacter sp.]